MPRPLHRPSAWFWGDRGAVLLLVLIFGVLNIPLLAGWVSEHWDGEAMFAPYYHHVASLIRSGSLLGWSPFSNGGSPDFAEPQYGASSPITLGFGLLAGPGPLGYHLYWLGLWLGGGLGMYVLARAMSAPPWGALVSGLGFALSGFYFGHAEHTSVVYTYSFMPWTLWRVRAALTTGRWRPACEAGALWGAAALAGNPAVHFPGALFIGAASPAFLLPLPADRAGRWQAARRYALTMGLLSVVAVLVLLPAYGAFRYEVAGYSHRTVPLPREVILSHGYGLDWLTALFLPAYVPIKEGLPGWAEYDVSMRPIYCGAPVLVLAGFAVWRRRAWAEWTILFAGLFCLGTAMGTTLPLRGWLYDLVPLTRFIRHPGMFRGYFVLAATMLAALGAARVERLRRVPDATPRLRLLAASAGVGAFLAVASYLWISALITDSLLAKVPRSVPAHLALAWLGTLAVCLLAVHREGFRRFLPGALVALAVADLAVAFQYSAVAAFAVKPSMTSPGPAGPLDDLGAAGWNRDADYPDNYNLYDRRPSFVNYTAMRNFIQEDWGSRPALCASVSGTHRLWFAADVPTVPPTVAAYDAFKARGRTLGALPVVRHERGDLMKSSPTSPAPPAATLAAIAAAPAARPVAAEVLAYHANDLLLRVQAPADGWLLVTERWARSWETTVNGQPMATDGGDFLFRLVPVRAGENVVAMRYRIGWWYALIALSWTTLAAVAVGAWRGHARRQASPAPPVDALPAPVQLPALATA